MAENSLALDGSWLRRPPILDHFQETMTRLRGQRTSKTTSLTFIFLCFGVLLSVRWAYMKGSASLEVIPATKGHRETLKKNRVQLKCPVGDKLPTCLKNYTARSGIGDSPWREEECPGYFRWIHEDLKPWKGGGISREVVESAKDGASFRLVIVGGRAYIEKYHDAFQTRDVFTIWGILQLLRLYPGRLPDLDLMFRCGDTQVVKKSDYNGSNAKPPPPMFGYCRNDETLTIVFPDWSFWGWPEIHIKPWESLIEELEEGNKKSMWIEREPYAYWKGNIYTNAQRERLLQCHPTDKQDWNVRIYNVDWQHAHHQGYKDTNLAAQCAHRYKIYVEGVTWSVSKKYILACDSLSLFMKPYYYDFFSRTLLPLIHYWPINERDECKSLKFAVDWGNNHIRKAQEIGRSGSNFIQEKLKMIYVYDYMFHLLNEYAKLLKYKPTVPPGAVEVCLETMACTRKVNLEKMYMVESMVEGPADAAPCNLPPPYDALDLRSFLKRKEALIKQVEVWEEIGNIGEEIFYKPK
ncbi:uncharacterized protein LOC131166379 isoform X2 [Malania oleifera]|uniref:uncharacterized protein LOC131166379 isoform X2 n=1 Tax=Malania oleifera TaxID=397392 RepID=UPI0025ADDD63|nr:uncharacterized protein LOC131166379 isoform X2 [Malania oleifera]XP_057980857.1 uncharacterized protein LOC131166379 isoform X2 [Malania oleifera]